MKTPLLDLLPELLELFVFGLGALGLSLAGATIERFALLTYQHGDPTVGMWAVVPGLVCLGFAYVLTTDKFLPKLRSVRTAVK
jgi:hypothetical protein